MRATCEGGQEPVRTFTDAERAIGLHPGPNTDVALMLGLAHTLYTLYTEGLHDEAFFAKYTVGFERFVPYLAGSPGTASRRTRDGRRRSPASTP